MTLLAGRCAGLPLSQVGRGAISIPRGRIQTTRHLPSRVADINIHLTGIWQSRRLRKDAFPLTSDVREPLRAIHMSRHVDSDVSGHVTWYPPATNQIVDHLTHNGLLGETRQWPVQDDIT